MMKKHLCILFLFSLVICFQTNAQNFDNLIEHFKNNNFVNLKITPKDSISENSIYKSEDFNVAISENPIQIELDRLVLENPYDFGDWDENYIIYPKSSSVIYKNNLISLFGNGKFVCHNLNNFQRNQTLEKKLNTKKFKYYWLIDDKLFASTKSLIFGGLFQWNEKKWKRSEIKNPVKKQPILFSDEEFIVYRKCSGEFGGTIYFYDRKSKETYYTESTCSNTVTKKDGIYRILAHLGHHSGTSEIKIIAEPRKLDKVNYNQLKFKSGNLGYQRKSNSFSKPLDFYGIQLFSTFKIADRQVFLTHFNERTFLVEINKNEIKIVNPLFDNDKYTHDPITRTYGKYTLISMDHYGTALEREVSVMIIENDKITLIDWNENHSR